MFVDVVSDTVDGIKEAIGEFHYQTKTRGERTTHAALIAGEAIYEIASDGQQTYFLYELELPHEPEEVQKTFNIQKEAILMMQVKNPHASGVNREGVYTAGLKGKEKPVYPASLQARFKGVRVPETKFTSLHPAMLDYKGTELLVLGVKHSPQEKIGNQTITYSNTDDSNHLHAH